MVFDYPLGVHDHLLFPFLDRFELWLLDRTGRSLALLESAINAEAVDLRRAGRPWPPGLESRGNFHIRTADGSGRGLHGLNLTDGHRDRRLEAVDFPEFMLDTRHHDESHRKLLDDFIAWQTPWLLLLPTLPKTMRRRYEELARGQPLKVAEHYRLYSEIVNNELIDAERVEARQLNERPRKTLGFETPAERFNACVASTG